MMLERDYRPSEKIGWNICAGGGIPPSKKGTKQRQDVKDKISAAHKGRTKSDEHLRNISQALKGKPSGHLGKKRKIVTCPHCHKSGGINTMTQWHFDKCKLNNRRS
jgi:hypothetical protein